MPIRKKLLLLFLALSLLPLLILGALSMRSTRKLGTRLVEQNHQSRLERERAMVRQTLNDAASRLSDHVRLLRFSVELQATAVERALSQAPSSTKVRWSSDFRNGSMSLSEMPGYTRRSGDDTPAPIPVSLDRVLSHLAPGIEWTSSPVRRDVGRLAGMAAAYRRVRAVNPSVSLWQYTVLTSGVHQFYPGHGALRSQRDDRKAPWYAEALDSDELVWSRPWLEPLTGQPVVTGARRVRGPDGKVVGVTAIDISLPQLFEHDGPSVDEWMVRPEVMFLRPVDGQVRVVARNRGGTAVIGAYEDEPDEALLQALEAVRDTGEVGRYNGLYNGRESVWAFRHVPETRAFLAVTAPVEQVAARLAEAQEFIVAGIRGQLLLLMVFLLVVGGAVSALAYPIASSVTAPLASLAGTAQAIAAGRLDSRASVRRKDEIASLAVSINKMAVSIENLVLEQEKGVHQMVKSLTKALEAKDTYTAAHSGSVTSLARRLGRCVGLDEPSLDLLTQGALVHDVGKIGIPEAILNKPGPLDEDEFVIMREHAAYADKIMRPLVRAKEFAQIARSHHERWDGNGYPDGLKGEEIPLLARIVSIVDSWDAMTGDRCYRKGMPVEKALGIFEAEKDSGQWDPKLVREFLAMMRERATPGQTIPSTTLNPPGRTDSP